MLKESKKKHTQHEHEKQEKKVEGGGGAREGDERRVALRVAMANA